MITTKKYIAETEKIVSDAGSLIPFVMPGKVGEFMALRKLHKEFTDKMYEKMVQKFNEGKEGWDNPECIRGLQDLLNEKLADGNWVDVANVAMFIWNIQH